jgi:hypothetical protein
MNLPEEAPPFEPVQTRPDSSGVSRARRRRARRALTRLSGDERSALLESLARRAYPSIEFFLFSLLCGALLGTGLILDAQILLLFGLLLAPMMTPWVGLCLAAVTGSVRFLIQTLVAFAISGALILGTGALSGLAARLWLPLPLYQATTHSRLWWPDLIVLAIGSVLLVFSFVRTESKPILPSMLLAYGFYLPLSAAGFGLGSGVEGFWPDGLLVFLVHLALSAVLGVATLAFLGFRPRTLPGCLLSLIIAAAALAALVILTGLGAALAERLSWSLPVPQATPTVWTATLAAVLSPATPSPTTTPSSTPPVTPSPAATLTPQPTPVYARILARGFDGAIMRVSPGGAVLTSLSNDHLVEVLPEIEEHNNLTWVHVRTTVPDGRVLEGWVLQSVLVTATPAPDW